VRYLAHRELPPTAYLPGRSPRPVGGDRPPRASWPARDFFLCDDYVWGIDLYNAGFSWEAHEAWERAWRSVDSEPARQLLQGLIQCAAAALKADVSESRTKLIDRALGHLAAASAGAVDGQPMCGIVVPHWIEQMTIWRHGMPRPNLALRIRSCDRAGTLTDAQVQPVGSMLIAHADCALARFDDRRDYWSGQAVIPHDPPASGDIEQWLARFIAELGRDVASKGPLQRLRVSWETGDTEAWPGATSLVAGDTYERSIVLRGDAPPSTAPPPGLAIRPLASDADWAAAAQLSDAESGPVLGPTHGPFIRWRYAEYRRALDTDRTGAFWGAFDGPLLVGSLGLFESSTSMRFQDVNTRATHRRRGVASALISSALAPAFARNPDAFGIIAAIPDSPAERLYRSLGFREIGSLHAVVRAVAG
jgi:GNAT superfamily N-acetyltransferase